MTNPRTHKTTLRLLLALAALTGIALAQSGGQVIGFNPTTGKFGEPMPQPVYDSPTGLPAPAAGEQVAATPVYVVNFLANELELSDAPCSISGVTVLICGESPDPAYLIEALVDTLFEMFLQPATRTLGWQTDPDSGARVAMFKRPEGTYGLSVTDGAATIAYLGP